VGSSANNAGGTNNDNSVLPAQGASDLYDANSPGSIEPFEIYTKNDRSYTSGNKRSNTNHASFDRTLEAEVIQQNEKQRFSLHSKVALH